MTAVLPRPTPGTLAAGVTRMRVHQVAAERRRIVWTDCSGNRHRWVVTPVGVVCRHCPVHARPTTHPCGQ